MYSNRERITGICTNQDDGARTANGTMTGDVWNAETEIPVLKTDEELYG